MGEGKGEGKAVQGHCPFFPVSSRSPLSAGASGDPPFGSFLGLEWELLLWAACVKESVSRSVRLLRAAPICSSCVAVHSTGGPRGSLPCLSVPPLPPNSNQTLLPPALSLFPLGGGGWSWLVLWLERTCPQMMNSGSFLSHLLNSKFRLRSKALPQKAGTSLSNPKFPPLPPQGCHVTFFSQHCLLTGSVLFIYSLTYSLLLYWNITRVRTCSWLFLAYSRCSVKHLLRRVLSLKSKCVQGPSSRGLTRVLENGLVSPSRSCFKSC